MAESRTSAPTTFPSRPLATVITGAGTGIGRALALELARRGQLVYATLRRPEMAEGLASERIRTAALDVADAESRLAFLARLEADGVDIGCLVNNAGFGLMGALADVPLDDVRRQLEVNVLAPLALAQLAFPGMAARRAGLIVNISSITSVLATPFAGAYSASKAALSSLSEAMRVEMAPFGVRVVTVEPGSVISEFGATAARQAAIPRSGHSLYAEVAHSVEARARISQTEGMSAEDFARALADVLLARGGAPAVVRIGPNTRRMLLLKRFLPSEMLDRILSRKFHLDRLAR